MEVCVSPVALLSTVQASAALPTAVPLLSRGTSSCSCTADPYAMSGLWLVTVILCFLVLTSALEVFCEMG